MYKRQAIQLANSKIDEIRGAFPEWLREQSSDFKDRRTDLYNRTFNCYVRPKYDLSLIHICQNPDCGLTVWRTVARKELTDKQLAELLTKGKTGTIRGFVKNGGTRRFCGIRCM